MVRVPKISHQFRTALKTIDTINKLSDCSGYMADDMWAAYDDAWALIEELAPEFYRSLTDKWSDITKVVRGYETWSNWFGRQMTDPLGY